MNLIYTVAYGNPLYLEMARFLVKSARDNGYEGRFVVLSDEKAAIEGADVILFNRSAHFFSKGAIRKYVNLSDYEKVLYVDTDILFQENPDKLFELDGIRIAVEEGKQSGDVALAANYNILFFTEEEKKLIASNKVLKVNSGTILLPGSEADSFLEGWERAWIEAPRRLAYENDKKKNFNLDLMDQPVLQAWLFREGIDWEAFPHGTVSFPFCSGSDSPAPVVHLCGPLNEGKNNSEQNKWAVLGEMQKRMGSFKDNTMLYTVCFGKEVYFRLAEEMIISARLKGFKGEIFVISDRDWVFPGAAKNIKTGWKLSRTEIRNHVDLSKYDKVLYSDSDIVFTKNPKHLMRFDTVAVATGTTWLHTAPATNSFMTEEEKEKAKAENAYGINSGTVAFPGKIGHDFLALWEKTWDEFDKTVLSDPWGGDIPNWQNFDESALQVLLLRGMEHHKFPYNEVNFPIFSVIPTIKERYGYNQDSFSSDCSAVHFMPTSIKIDHWKTLEWMKSLRGKDGVPVALEKVKSDFISMMQGKNPMRVMMDKLNRMESEIQTLTKAVIMIGEFLKKEKQDELV